MPSIHAAEGNSQMFTGVALFEIIKALGLPGAMFAVCYILIIVDERKWRQYRTDEFEEREKERQERERERTEHMAKWDSMIKTHANETDRAYKLIERQTEAIEMHASLLNLVNERINQNQFCPIVRDRQKGTG